MKINPDKLDLEEETSEPDILEEISECTNEGDNGWESEYYGYELARILNLNEKSMNEILKWISDDEIKEIVNKWKEQHMYRLGRRLNIDNKALKALTRTYHPRNIEAIVNGWKNQHTIDLKNFFEIDVKAFRKNYPKLTAKEIMDKIFRKNYPKLTAKEIMDKIQKQKDYSICFIHKHKGITEKLIKKYLLLDEYRDNQIMRVTLKTPETHDCHLVKLTPELEKKAYWGCRGNRRVVSHIINKEDYPYENKTNKLTVVGKWEIDSYYDREIDDWVEGEPYFLVITAFRGEGNSRREILDEDLWHGNLDKYDDINDCAKFWLGHALIPEEDEIYIEEEPFWVKCYKNGDL